MDISNFLSTEIRIKTFYKQLLADMETPVSSYIKLSNGLDSFMLESMEGDGHSGRFSIIGMKPMLIFKATGNQSAIADPISKKELSLSGNPLDNLKLVLSKFKFDRDEPFECGFLCGYLSYDSIRYIEEIPANSINDLQLPDIYLILPSEIVVFDNFTQTQKLIVHLEETDDTNALAKQASDRLNKMIDRFSNRSPKIKKMRKTDTSTLPKIKMNIKTEDYFQSVLKAKEYIRNGDIFQVVLSRRFQTDIDCNPFDIYRMLHLINPSPYMFYLNFEGIKLVGSSPETMVKYDGERVTVRPIAGTRKRGANRKEDKEIAAGLLKDEKELAEHVMLVDLGRNDVGRIANYGSVNLDTFKQVENYSHVMHIVSTVSGELKKGFDAVDIFKACFPAGTVSGAPKIRAMEIIDELEKTRRGPYAGAIGYFDFKGRTDTCIAIRTLFIKDKTAYWQAGGGIVADSDPEYEFEETENKAKALLKAISLAEEFNHDTGN